MKDGLSDDQVTSIWGRITRRELFERLGAGILLGTASSLPAMAQRIGGADVVKAPYKPLTGQPFREFSPPIGSVKDLLQNSPLKSEGKRPPVRRRDAFWYSKPNAAKGFDIFQYTQSRNHLSNSCAQAALATLLHKFNAVPRGLSGDAVTDRIYETHPPDQPAGTTIPVLVRAMKDYGLNSWFGYGAEHGEQVMRSTLRQWVAAGYPCVVLLDMRGPTRRPYDAFFAHYVVVFAYDDDESTGHVYMSNWDYRNWGNSWSTFKQAWSLADYPARSYPLVLGWK